MIILNDFFVRYKEAVSNQMELIAKDNNAKIISATRFMGQKEMQKEDIEDNIFIYSPLNYIINSIRIVIKSSKDEKIHIFEEEPSFWKRWLLNKTKNPLYVSMYRRPNNKYIKHLKKYKMLKKVFVELPYHKEILIENGIEPNVIEVTPTPSKITRKRSKKEYNSQNIEILFASWNNKEKNAIKERGLEYLLEILQVNPNAKLKIPLRDNDTEEFEKMTKKLNVQNQVELLQINNDEKKLAELFEQADYIFFAPQKRVVKDVPNSLIDGIVRGKPVIISDVIDFSKEVVKYNIGVVVKKGDSPIKLNMSKAEYEEKSKNAYEYSKIYTKQNYLEKINSSYSRREEFIDALKIETKNLKNERSNNENSNSKYMGDIR